MRSSTIATLALALGVSLGGAGVGAEPKPYPEFTFKRVKVPAPGSGRRILVQIEPAPVVAAPVAAEPEAPAATSPVYDWYWSAVSPRRDAGAGGERLRKAVLQLDKRPDAVPAPRLQALQKILARHGAAILSATVGTQVSPALVLAVMSTESSGRTDAVSPKGATGLMQLMPDTASRFGVTDISDPAENIRGGVAYLDWLMDHFDRDPVLVLAGYNAGEGAVSRHEGVPPYSETRAYVPKVLSAWRVARGLCLTPPELVTDGCAFGVRAAARR